MRKLDRRKKLEITYNVTLGINLGESLLLPVILILMIPLAYVNYATMWIALVLVLLCWCGTAIVANVIAGLNIKKRWCAALLPFVLTLPACFVLICPKYEQLLWAILIDILVNVLMCVAPLLISAACQRKKAAIQAMSAQAEEKENTIKENNETI